MNYRDIVLGLGPAHYFPLNDGLLNDIGSGGQVITTSGGPSFLDGSGPSPALSDNKSLILDGINDSLNLGNLGNTPSQGTFSYWWMSTGGFVQWSGRSISNFGFAQGNNNNYFREIYQVSGNGGATVYFHNSGWSGAVTLPSFGTGSWNMFALGWDKVANQWEVVVNGVSRSNVGSWSNFPASFPDFRLGVSVRDGVAKYHAMRVAQVAYHHVRLTAQDIANLYAAINELTIAISGVALTSAGDPADFVRIFSWPDNMLIESVVPNADGSWTALVAPGQYGLTYIADGCQPITHGPYTVAE